MKDTFFYPNFQLNIRGKLVQFDHPIVMGILNVTPDSFFAESRIDNEQSLIKRAGEMLDAGAAILDLGGYSSRPGAREVSPEEETERVVWAVNIIVDHFPNAFISIDTFRSQVAAKALEAGAHLINDISGGQLDEAMYETAARFKAPYILMHMRGTPQTMTNYTDYENLISDLQYFFSQRIQLARAKGVKDIILDPGFGFSKTIQQNFKLMQNLEQFLLHECPVLAGISRKSMIYKTLDIEVAEALNGTTAVNMFALTKGVSILRVHDVKEAIEVVRLYSAIRCAE